MGCIEDIGNILSKATCTPSVLLSGRGFLHLLQILSCASTFVLSCFKWGGGHTYWIYAMFTWAFCPLLTLAITVAETLTLDVALNMFCMDWADFTTGVAMLSSLMTLSVAIAYANFYACLTCPFRLVIIGLAFLCAVVYLLEVLKDKLLDKRKASYLAALPGFFKCSEAFVSCVIFISLTSYRDQPMLIACVVAYVVPFSLLPVIIVINLLKKLKKCLPFNLDRFVFMYLVVSVLLYIFAAVTWPIFTFRNNPRPSHCPPSFCIWAIQFVVTFMTYVNLILFTVDLIFTLLGICGFKRN